MIHPKILSPSYNRQRKKRQTNSGRKLAGSPQTIRLDDRAIPKVPSNDQPTDSFGFFEVLEQERVRAEKAKMLEKKKRYPIAPDAFIPNSRLRSMFKIQQLEPVEVKMFRLRLIPPLPSKTHQMDLDERLKRYSVLTNFDGIHSTISQTLNLIDILENLQSKTNKNLNWQNDDDEWVELGDPEVSIVETTSKPSSAKKSKSIRSGTETLVSRQKETVPEVFKRMKKEAWWQQIDDEENNTLRSMLFYLIDILRDKDPQSYESACNYVVEIFRTYGIEASLVDQILGILLDHLALSDNDPLDIHTVRTLAQFMIERKNIIIQLLDFGLRYQPDNILRQETINAIKFITDVNSSDDIDIAFGNMPVVRDTADDTFSLKTIIERIKSKQKKAPSDLSKKGGEEEDEIYTLHPLLKKISEERWFPHDNTPITLDSIIDAILSKLPTASKTMLKTFTAHLVQLQRVIGYSNEQYDRVANGLISLLAHNDADHRLIAATILADLGKETKAVDIALLNSFLNDARVLVRTECCDTLKKLSAITSESVLKDCADEISYLQTLPEEGFTLQNYLNEKNRVPTPPPPTTTTDEQSAISVEEKPAEEEEEEEAIVVVDEQEENIISTNEDEQETSDKNIEDSVPPPSTDDQIDDVSSFVRSRSPAPSGIDDQLLTQINRSFVQPATGQFSVTPSAISSATPLASMEPPIRVEIIEKTKPVIPVSQQVPQPRKEFAPPPPPPPPSSQPNRARKQISEQYNRTPIKITFPGQSTGKRTTLLPNNSDMWDSYTKQYENNDEETSEILPPIEFNQEQIPDPIQTILEDHKRHIGYYRMMPNRHVLIPHKISFNGVFADLSHMTIDRKTPYVPTSYPTGAMHLSDLNRNKRHLQEVEFMQLLSSLIVRSIQIHRRHERFLPGPFSTLTDSSTSFMDALTISQMQLHSPTNFEHMSFYIPNKLPPIVTERPSSAQMTKMKSDVHSRAKRTGVNLRKAKDMEDALSHILKTDSEQSRSTFVSTNTPHPSTYVTASDSGDVTHGWLLEQLLKSQGAPDSPSYIQQISRAYPKFTPLLYSRIPQSLIPIIWNDPVMKQLASIVSNKQDDSSKDDLTSKRSNTKSSVPTFDDEHSSNFFDHSASSQLLNMQQQQRDDHKKKFLPPIRGAKMRLPRHILKFGFRELEGESPEASLVSLRDETVSKARRRRIYMHLMMSVNTNMLVRHEFVKSQYRHMLKTDPRTRTFLPIINKPPVCN